MSYKHDRRVTMYPRVQRPCELVSLVRRKRVSSTRLSESTMVRMVHGRRSRRKISLPVNACDNGVAEGASLKWECRPWTLLGPVAETSGIGKQKA